MKGERSVPLLPSLFTLHPSPYPGDVAQFGLVGGLMLAWWKKRSRKKLEQRLAHEDQQDIEFLLTRDPKNFLIHPGQGFLASIGCINPCTSLPNAAEMIDFVPSRKRVIAIINDLKAFSGGDFPTKNGKEIPNAFVVIDGEPEFPV